MIRTSAFMLVLTLLITGACTPQRYAVGGETGSADGLHLRQSSFLAAMAARDADQMAAHFSEDAVVHIANQPALRGRSVIRQFYGTVFRFLEGSDAVAEMTHVSAAGDLAYSVGRVDNVFRGEDGAVSYAGKYLLVWENHGGEWLIAAYTVSSDQPGGR
jgi:ketosteroid isomerase-like protein